MLRKNLIAAAIAMTAVTATHVQALESCPRVEGFYATWDNPVGGELPVTDLAFDKLTHVIVSFAYPQSDGSMDTSEADTVVDELVAEAHANNTGVMISVGGAGVDFLSMDAEARTNLVNNLVVYAEEHNLDGVDVDWEHWSTHGQPNVEESERLLQFVADLRAALPAHLEVSVDVQAGGWSGINFHEDLDDHADIIRFMAYDYTGGWGSSPIDHHANWDAIHGGLTATWEGSHSMIRKYDVAKTAIGVPFYNKVFRDGGNAVVDTVTAQDIVNDLVIGMNIDYNMGTYIVDGDTYTWETPNLIQQKSQFAKDNGYPGVFIWELHQDTKEQPNQLLSAINEVLPKCEPCAEQWQGYPAIYNAGDMVSVKGRNYEVVGGPLHSVAPETLGHAHRYVDAGSCRNFVLAK